MSNNDTTPTPSELLLGGSPAPAPLGPTVSQPPLRDQIFGTPSTTQPPPLSRPTPTTTAPTMTATPGTAAPAVPSAPSMAWAADFFARQQAVQRPVTVQPWRIDGSVADLIDGDNSGVLPMFHAYDYLTGLNAYLATKEQPGLDPDSHRRVALVLDKAIEFALGDAPITPDAAAAIDYRPVIAALGNPESDLYRATQGWFAASTPVTLAQELSAPDLPAPIADIAKFELAADPDGFMRSITDLEQMNPVMQSLLASATNREVEATQMTLASQGIEPSSPQGQRAVVAAMNYSASDTLTVAASHYVEDVNRKQLDIEERVAAGDSFTEEEVIAAGTIDGADYGAALAGTEPVNLMSGQSIQELFQFAMDGAWSQMIAYELEARETDQSIGGVVALGDELAPPRTTAVNTGTLQGIEQASISNGDRKFSTFETLNALYSRKPAEIRELQTKLAYAGYFDELGALPTQWGSATDKTTTDAWKKLTAEAIANGVTVTEQLRTRQRTYIKNKRRAAREMSPYEPSVAVTEMAQEWARDNLLRSLTDSEIEQVWKASYRFAPKPPVSVLGVPQQGLGPDEWQPVFEQRLTDYMKEDAFTRESAEMYSDRLAYLFDRYL